MNYIVYINGYTYMSGIIISFICICIQTAYSITVVYSVYKWTTNAYWSIPIIYLCLIQNQSCFIVAGLCSLRKLYSAKAQISCNLYCEASSHFIWLNLGHVFISKVKIVYRMVKIEEFYYLHKIIVVIYPTPVCLVHRLKMPNESKSTGRPQT